MGSLVASGSDDGRLYIWEQWSATIACIGERSDSVAVNTIAPHPEELCLATGGIDPTVKLWAPSAKEPQHAELIEPRTRNYHHRHNLASIWMRLLGGGAGLVAPVGKSRQAVCASF